ncbi:ORF106 [Spodoptera frugiperda granulovirus]|uniref:ORF106 n=1 Tax=Spodoptera frugiperda granulovirus TaxID=307454 RepID=A0A0C5ASG8_9BBAC|nr:ORF106 [Spodoptera frugiperda granulovirus]AJK91767.1 ORF106 [Spodoptera frugiperda granulovirus]AXS01130.1 ORF110 [Spodoptera frugiperda granulovirus]
MIVVIGIVAFVVLAFLLNKTLSGSEIIITMLILFVLFFCILNVYYVNTDSAPKDLYNEDTKKAKKKKHLNDVFDAILNKNNSSLE